jgi:hypothetical protein
LLTSLFPTVTSDYTTDRSEVTPTGRNVGTVFVGKGPLYYVKIEKWFTETENFSMGTWREIASERPGVGETVYQETVEEGW